MKGSRKPLSDETTNFQDDAEVNERKETFDCLKLKSFFDLSGSQTWNPKGLSKNLPYQNYNNNNKSRNNKEKIKET